MGIHAFLKEWQSLLGALLGASVPFLVWWLAKKYEEYEKRKNDVNFLQKAVIDQINSLNSVKQTVESFIEKTLTKLLNSSDINAANNYFTPVAFFPLFSARAFSEDFQKRNIKSAYIDNKLLKVYTFSHDFPHFMNDARRQFEMTLDMNQEMSFGKLNPPIRQNIDFKQNISNYKKMLESQILHQNIPTFFKLLVESLVVLEEMSRLGLIRWRLKFDPFYRFYWSRKKYKEAQKDNFSKIDQYFEPLVQKRIEEIYKIFH